MKNLREVFADLDEKAALRIVRSRLKSGEDPEKVLSDLRLGLRKVGERFEARDYALIELEMASILFKECVAEVESLKPSDRKLRERLEAFDAEKRLAEVGEVE